MIILLLLAAVLAFPATALADELGNEAPESIPFYDRELSFRGRLVHFTLSRERALETRVEALDFYLRTGCRLYLDAGQVRQDKNSFDTIGVGLRTFMIEADGTYNRAWSFRLGIGGLTQGGRFDGSQVFIDEGYVAYAADRFRWTAGQQTEPFSLENDMSGLATTFMERALPNALTPGKYCRPQSLHHPGTLVSGHRNFQQGPGRLPGCFQPGPGLVGPGGVRSQGRR